MGISVTGAAGFLGRNVCDVFEGRGIGHVRHTRGTSEDSGGFVCFDLEEPPSDCFEKLGSPETLVHLAWGGLPNYRSLHHFEKELPLHYHFLKEMVKAGTKKLVVTGTCFEYGMVEGCLSEEQPTNPSNPYGFAKDSLRRSLEFLQQEIDFELVWLRLFYLQGDGQPERSLFGQLEKAIDSGDDEFPMSGGEQLRDYLPISEVVDAIAELTIRDVGSLLVNICSGQPVSVRRVVEENVRERGASISLSLGAIPYSEVEPFSFWGSNERLKSVLR